MAEPINDDKTLIRKDLLPLITNPRAATTLDGITTALEDWDTNLRLFREAGGSEPNDESKRLTLVQLLPPDVSAYVAMHMELPELSNYTGMKRFAQKYVKILQNLKRRSGKLPAHVIEKHGSPGEDRDEEDEGAAPGEPSEELDLTCLEGLDAQQQIEILAVMKKQGFRAPTRRQGGSRGTAARTGARTATQFNAGAKPPPRGRDDITCVNCGKKGHMASECRGVRVDTKDRPCFNCGEKGHLARNCPKPKAVNQVEASAEANVPRRAIVCMVEARERPMPQPAVMADYIKKGKMSKATTSTNRFRPLTLEDVEFWQDVQEVQSKNDKSTENPQLSDVSFPPLPGGDKSAVDAAASTASVVERTEDLTLVVAEPKKKKKEKTDATSADEDFDLILREKWQKHLTTLPEEEARVKGWKSHYWKRWLAEVVELGASESEECEVCIAEDEDVSPDDGRVESIEGSPPDAEEDRRAGPELSHKHQQGGQAKSNIRETAFCRDEPSGESLPWPTALVEDEALVCGTCE